MAFRSEIRLESILLNKLISGELRVKNMEESIEEAT